MVRSSHLIYTTVTNTNNNLNTILQIFGYILDGPVVTFKYDDDNVTMISSEYLSDLYY